MRDFDKMMNHYNLNYHKLAVILGMKYNSVKSLCAPKKSLPRWAKFGVWVWKQQLNK